MFLKAILQLDCEQSLFFAQVREANARCTSGARRELRGREKKRKKRTLVKNRDCSQSTAFWVYGCICPLITPPKLCVLTSRKRPLHFALIYCANKKTDKREHFDLALIKPQEELSQETQIYTLFLQKSFEK